MLDEQLASKGLLTALDRPRPRVRLHTYVYREQSSHGFSVEGLQGGLDVDVSDFWLACLGALDEGEVVEDATEMRALIALCRPAPIPQAALQQSIDAVCRGHLAVVRSTILRPVLGVRLTLAWNLDAVYVRSADAQYGFFWHTSE